MQNRRMEYLKRFMDDVDTVSRGKKDAISGDRYLCDYYDGEFFSILRNELKSPDQNVRADTVRLLTKLNERSAMEDIKSLQTRDNNYVGTACLGYLSKLNEADSLIPDLIDMLRHKRGYEFRNAAIRMGSIGRASDVPELRMIYGQVDGEMREQMFRCLQDIIGRYPELKKKEHLITSVPIYPDDDSFAKFVDNAIVYLDIRYRDAIFPRSKLPVKTYNNIVVAIKTMQIRLYNEEVNLQYYGKEAVAQYEELKSLIVWVSEDLKMKSVEKEAYRVERVKNIYDY